MPNRTEKTRVVKWDSPEHYTKIPKSVKFGTIWNVSNRKSALVRNRKKL